MLTEEFYVLEILRTSCTDAHSENSEQAKGLGLPPLPVHEVLKVERYSLRLRQGRTLTQFHGFYDHGRALPTLALPTPSQRDGSPHNAFEPSVNDGDAIRIYNRRGEMHARARVTDDVPSGTVWMRDGWLGLNTLTDGAAVIPDEMVEIFSFFGGRRALTLGWKSWPPGLTASLS
jgi:predicted molibdopterin-dependent oxidoreductase YjgC